MLPAILIDLLLLLLPGAYAYLKGRQYLRMVRDDEFPLKYFKYQQQIAFVFWLCLILFFVLIPILPGNFNLFNKLQKYTLNLGLILIFLLAYTFFLCGFSIIDQTVREERVAILHRLKFNLTLFFLMGWPYLFFVLLAFGFGEYYFVRVVLILTLYFILYFYTPSLWSFLLRAQASQDKDLLIKFNDLAAMVNLKPVTPFIFDAEGLKFANAFSVGNFGGQKAVFFSRFVNESLSPQELQAIYAHELGHLQRNQIRRRSLALLIPVLIIPVINLIIGRLSPLLPWFLFIVALLIIRIIVPAQKFEKEADLCGARASGDVDIYITSLEKIYRLGILPRRFSLADEKKFSHPSLTERIKHIRKTTGHVVPKLSTVKDFTAEGAVRQISFASDHLNIHYKNGVEQSIPYIDIVAMQPVGLKDKSRLIIRYRLKNKPEKIIVNASYHELNEIIEIVEQDFSEGPKADPAQFNRSYYLWSVVIGLFGLAFSFIIGPVLVILAFIGLIKRNVRFLLSYSLACFATTMTILLLAPEPTYFRHQVFAVILGSVALLTFIDYLRFKDLLEIEKGKGRLSYAFSLVFSIITTILLIIIFASDQTPTAMQSLGVIIFNLTTLSAGLLISRRLKESRRRLMFITNTVIFFLNLGIMHFWI